jgi:diguanylate cyclase (GGDEF)-like protein/PAS domain S-box-containing protein
LRQRLIGQRRWDSGLQIDTEGGWDAHRALLDARQPFHDLLMWRRMDDGRLRWVEVSGEPVFAPDGSFAGYRGVGRDVTARKRDEALLRLEHTAARGLADAEDSAKALQAVLKAVCETEQWDCGLYFQVDEAAGRLRCVEAWGRDGARDFVEGLAAAQFERGAGLAGHVWASGEPLWVPDVHADRRVSPAGRELATRIHAALVFPVVADGRVLGVLSFSSERILEPDARLQQTIGVIGSQVGQFLRRRHAEESLRDSESRFRRTFELAGSGFAHIGLDRRFMRVNRRLCEILGYPESELMRLTGRDISHPEDLDVINRQRPRLYAGEVETVRTDKRYLRKDGSVVWVTLTLALERDAAGKPQYEIAVYDDITARKAAEDALRESEARFRSLTQMSSDFFWESDAQHQFTQLVYGPSYQAVHVDHDAMEAIRPRLESMVAFRDFEFARKLPDGATRYFTVSGDPRFASDGSFLGYRGVGRDTTEIALAREHIASLAYNDPLTGLANRTSLGPSLEQSVQRTRRRNAKLAVLFMDLDGFKQINDRHGHDAGDALLVEVAERLRANLRASDLVARLGGDEFLVVLEEVHDLAPVEIVARKLQTELRRPFTVSGHEVQVSGSIGISVFPDDAADAGALMKHADTAMYLAKQAGRNTYRFYSAGPAANEPQPAERSAPP